MIANNRQTNTVSKSDAGRICWPAPIQNSYEDSVMGLDISHEAFSGAYSSFMMWRRHLVQTFTQLSIEEVWQNESVCPAALRPLIFHSDCEGDIELADLPALADALEALIPLLPQDEQTSRYCHQHRTRKFIKGCRLAIEEQENLEFH